MTAKPVVPRRLADDDILAAIEHYRIEADLAVARTFVAAIETAFAMIGTAPATGSPRHGDELGIAGLRTRRLGRFPYLVFYVEHDTHIDVWRVLHEKRDFAEWLNEPR